eukprot:9484885-Pyramimonas_sp.AAC.1
MALTPVLLGRGWPTSSRAPSGSQVRSMTRRRAAARVELRSARGRARPSPRGASHSHHPAPTAKT